LTRWTPPVGNFDDVSAKGRRKSSSQDPHHRPDQSHSRVMEPFASINSLPVWCVGKPTVWDQVRWSPGRRSARDLAEVSLARQPAWTCVASSHVGGGFARRRIRMTSSWRRRRGGKLRPVKLARPQIPNNIDPSRRDGPAHPASGAGSDARQTGRLSRTRGYPATCLAVSLSRRDARASAPRGW
jgi:hypothetical protein